MKKNWIMFVVIGLWGHAVQASHKELQLKTQEKFARLRIREKENLFYVTIFKQFCSEFEAHFKNKDKNLIIFASPLHQGYDHDQQLVDGDPLLQEYVELERILQDYKKQAEQARFAEQNLFKIEEEEF